MFRIRSFLPTGLTRLSTGNLMFQPFTEEHDHFRKTVRDFAEKELLPNAEFLEIVLVKVGQYIQINGVGLECIGILSQGFNCFRWFFETACRSLKIAVIKFYRLQAIYFHIP